MNKKEGNGKEKASRKRWWRVRKEGEVKVKRDWKREVYLPRLRVDVEYIILLQIELEEATGHLKHD